MSDDKRIGRSISKGGIATRPQQKDWMKKLETATGKPIEAPKPQRAVYLVVDCSGSMDGDKLEQAKRGGSGFANEAQGKGYAVGLIKFDSTAEHILEPQRETANFNSSLQRLVIGGSTNMAAGIQLAITNLTSRRGEKAICIITDGQPDDRTATLNLAREAKNAGIDILTIGTDDAEASFLAELATRKELSLKVSSKQLQQGIASMAKMLPDKT